MSSPSQPSPSEKPASPTIEGVGVRTTNYPTIKNASLPYEGNGSFSNIVLASLILVIPYFVKRFVPIISWGGVYTYCFLVAVLGVPITLAYWTHMSIYGARKNKKCSLPGKRIEEYIEIKDFELERLYGGIEKIPMQIFHDAYFEGKVDFKGESLASASGIYDNS